MSLINQCGQLVLAAAALQRCLCLCVGVQNLLHKHNHVDLTIDTIKRRQSRVLMGSNPLILSWQLVLLASTELASILKRGIEASVLLIE